MTTASRRWSTPITNRQIESARIAINRHIKRGGKVWINIFPDRPLTKKPAETRMGSGKGSPEWWVANVKPGRVLFELSYPDEKTAREALTRAIHKLPIKARIVTERSSSDGSGVGAGELRELTDDELTDKLRESEGRAVQPALPDGHRAAGQQPSASAPFGRRSRIYTVLRERELGLASGPDGEDS